MPLSAKEILKNIDAGNIFVDPFIPENVKGASVDVRLGGYFFECRRYDGEGPIVAYNPWSKNFAKEYWGQPKCASPLRHCPPNITNAPQMREEDGDSCFIALQPKRIILGHTYEFIGSSTRFVGNITGRSSLSRSGVTIVGDGTWGDPGYFGRWVLKIENLLDCILMLPVGRRIAQIVFHEVRNGQTYAKENGGGKYQITEDRERIKREWKPEMILPRLHLDREVVQAPVEILR